MTDPALHPDRRRRDARARPATARPAPPGALQRDRRAVQGVLTAAGPRTAAPTSSPTSSLVVMTGGYHRRRADAVRGRQVASRFARRGLSWQDSMQARFVDTIERLTHREGQDVHEREPPGRPTSRSSCSCSSARSRPRFSAPATLEILVNPVDHDQRLRCSRCPLLVASAPRGKAGLAEPERSVWVGSLTNTAAVRDSARESPAGRASGGPIRIEPYGPATLRVPEVRPTHAGASSRTSRARWSGSTRSSSAAGRRRRAPTGRARTRSSRCSKTRSRRPSAT